MALDRNERQGPLPDWFLREARAALTSDLFTVYPSTDRVYDSLAEDLGVERQRLLLTLGSDGAFRSLFEAYGEPGRGVVLVDPSYAMYRVYGEMAGMRVVALPVDRELRIDPENLLEAIQPGVRLVCLPNPNQPTGTLMPDSELRAVADRAAEIGAILAIDEAYYPFSRTTVLPWSSDYDNVLVTRTFSKAWGLAGLRIGFVVGAPDLIATLYKVRSVYDISAFAVRCLELALRNPQIAEDYVTEVEAGREVLRGRVEALGLRPVETATNFMPIRLEGRAEPGDLVDRLRDRGCLVRGPFRHPALADCIRVTLGPPDLMAKFATELEGAIGTFPTRPTTT